MRTTSGAQQKHNNNNTFPCVGDCRICTCRIHFNHTSKFCSLYSSFFSVLSLLHVPCAHIQTVCLSTLPWAVCIVYIWPCELKLLSFLLCALSNFWCNGHCLRKFDALRKFFKNICETSEHSETAVSTILFHVHAAAAIMSACVLVVMLASRRVQCICSLSLTLCIKCWMMMAMQAAEISGRLYI